jgi:hypothetical protein
MCLVGFFGFVYLGSGLISGETKSFFKPLELFLYAAFPLAAYGLFVLGGVLLLHNHQLALTLVAAGMVSLLAVAIRNTWAIAIGVVSTPSRTGIR